MSPHHPRSVAWRRYLRFFGANVDADVEDELQFHLEKLTADFERQGMARSDAERLARERFGDLAGVSQALRTHDRRRLRELAWRDRLAAAVQGVQLAARRLWQVPGWTVTLTLTLTLGIGLATAVYTIADALLVRPLPVRAPDRIAVLSGTPLTGNADHFPLLYADALEYRRRTQTLDDVAFFAYGGAQRVAMDLDAGVVQLRRALVSGNYFAFLGTVPLRGRMLRESDDVLGAAPVAVLSYAAWNRLYGGDSSVIGRQIALHSNGTVYTIVGVMPSGLDYPMGVDFWAPVVPNSPALGGQPIYAELNVIGRLRSGASLADAANELTRFFAVKDSTWRIQGHATSLQNEILGEVRPAVIAFGIAAALLLFITCMNVANLLLVRGLGRVRELAVRAALGAERGRLIAQLLTESALLALAGGTGGTALALSAVKAFIAVAPAGTPRLAEIHIGTATIASAVGLTTLALLCFGVAPSVTASRVDVQEALRSGSQQSGGGRRFRRGARALVVLQMSLAVLVLCVAALVGRSLISLSHVPLVRDPGRLLIVELALPKGYKGGAQGDLVSRLSTRLSAIPGVDGVAPVFTRPFAPVGGVFGRIAAEGQTAEEEARNPITDFEITTPHAFGALGIRLLQGREFTEADREGAPAVAVISQSIARHYWPGTDPIGKRFVRGPGDFVTIVGVVNDTHYRDLRNPRPRVYYPLRQSEFPFAPTTLVISTAQTATSLIPLLRRVVAEAAPGVAVASATPFGDYFGEALAQPRMNALLLALFAGAAVLLAAVGLFGVMATMVRQRARELSLRLALGAAPAALRASVLREAAAIACTGLVIGLFSAVGVSRGVSTLLFGVRATDPAALGLASVVLLGVAVIAAHIPAARAQRMDPATVLRAE